MAKRPQTDERELPLHLRLNGLSRETDLPANPRPVTHVELAKAVQLQSESIRAQMIEQGAFKALAHEGVPFAACSLLCVCQQLGEVPLPASSIPASLRMQSLILRSSEIRAAHDH